QPLRKLPLRLPMSQALPYPPISLLSRGYCSPDQRHLRRRLAPTQRRDELLRRHKPPAIRSIRQRILQVAEHAIRQPICRRVALRVVDTYLLRIEPRKRLAQRRADALVVRHYLRITANSTNI